MQEPRQDELCKAQAAMLTTLPSAPRRSWSSDATDVRDIVKAFLKDQGLGSLPLYFTGCSCMCSRLVLLPAAAGRRAPRVSTQQSPCRVPRSNSGRSLAVLRAICCRASYAVLPSVPGQTLSPVQLAARWRCVYPGLCALMASCLVSWQCGHFSVYACFLACWCWRSMAGSLPVLNGNPELVRCLSCNLVGLLPIHAVAIGLEQSAFPLADPSSQKYGYPPVAFVHFPKDANTVRVSGCGHGWDATGK